MSLMLLFETKLKRSDGLSWTSEETTWNLPFVKNYYSFLGMDNSRWEGSGEFADRDDCRDWEFKAEGGSHFGKDTCFLPPFSPPQLPLSKGRARIQPGFLPNRDGPKADVLTQGKGTFPILGICPIVPTGGWL